MSRGQGHLGERWDLNPEHLKASTLTRLSSTTCLTAEKVEVDLLMSSSAIDLDLLLLPIVELFLLFLCIVDLFLLVLFYCRSLLIVCLCSKPLLIGPLYCRSLLIRPLHSKSLHIGPFV